MKNSKTVDLVRGAVIAAMYVALTGLAKALGLADMAIQVRFSEALCILPVFTKAAVPGLFVGCLLSNILYGAVIWDVIFGSVATLLGAIGTYLLRRHRTLSLLPPIVSNIIIVPPILSYAYGIEGGIPLFMLTVGLGEAISCGILGTLLGKTMDKYSKYLKF